MITDYSPHSAGNDSKERLRQRDVTVSALNTGAQYLLLLESRAVVILC